MRNRCLEIATEHPAVTWLNSVLSAPSLPRLEQVLSIDPQTVINYAPVIGQRLHRRRERLHLSAQSQPRLRYRQPPCPPQAIETVERPVEDPGQFLHQIVGQVVV